MLSSWDSVTSMIKGSSVLIEYASPSSPLPSNGWSEISESPRVSIFDVGQISMAIPALRHASRSSFVYAMSRTLKAYKEQSVSNSIGAIGDNVLAIVNHHSLFSFAIASARQYGAIGNLSAMKDRWNVVMLEKRECLRKERKGGCLNVISICLLIQLGSQRSRLPRILQFPSPNTRLPCAPSASPSLYK